MIANAGIAGGAAGPGAFETAETARAVFDTSLGGTLNAVLPLVPRLVGSRQGRIALVSSLAAFAPLSNYPSYSGAKAALLAYGLALREDLRHHGISVTIACPSFVAMLMGEGYRGARPFEMNAEAAAGRILNGAMRNRGVVAFPRGLAALARLAGAMPEGTRRWEVGLLGPPPG